LSTAARVSASPVAGNSRVDSGVSNQDSGVSHSNSLDHESQETNEVSPEVAVVAVDNHHNNANEGEDVKYKGIDKVSNEKSSSSLAGTTNTHRDKDSADDHDKNSSMEESEEGTNQLEEG